MDKAIIVFDMILIVATIFVGTWASLAQHQLNQRRRESLREFDSWLIENSPKDYSKIVTGSIQADRIDVGKLFGEMTGQQETVEESIDLTKFKSSNPIQAGVILDGSIMATFLPGCNETCCPNGCDRNQHGKLSHPDCAWGNGNQLSAENIAIQSQFINTRNVGGVVAVSCNGGQCAKYYTAPEDSSANDLLAAMPDEWLCVTRIAGGYQIYCPAHHSVKKTEWVTPTDERIFVYIPSSDVPMVVELVRLSESGVAEIAENLPNCIYFFADAKTVKGG